MNSNRRKSSGYRAFTLSEMLIVAAIAVITLVAIPLFVFQRNNLSVNSKHGEYECYYDNDNNIKSVNHSGDESVQEEVISNGCKFIPPVGVKKFIVQTIPSTGGGANAFLNFDALYNSELQAGDEFDVFNATNIEDQDEFPSYRIEHPTIETLKDRDYTNGFFDNVSDDTLNQILATISNKIAENSIEVRLRAPNGVQPLMQYMKPNINYPHFRGLGLFGNQTIMKNMLTTTSNLPWPNLLRYPEMAFSQEDKAAGNSFLTFKEMFVDCSYEDKNGNQAKNGTSCFDQCNSLFRYKDLPTPSDPQEVVADALKPLFLKCDTDIVGCNQYSEDYELMEDGSSDDSSKSYETYLDTESKYAFQDEALPYPVYGRTMIVGIKTGDQDIDDLREKLLKGTGSLLIEGGTNLIDIVKKSRILSLTSLGKAIQKGFTDFGEYLTTLGNAISALNESHRVTTIRNEAANLSMLGVNGDGEVYFHNPMSACQFDYLDRNKATKTISILNPEVKVGDPFYSQTFSQHESPYKSWTIDSLGENEYPSSLGKQLPRGAYICGVAHPDSYELEYINGIELECTDWKTSNILCETWKKERKKVGLIYINVWKCDKYKEVCEKWELSEDIETVKYSGLYNIEDDPHMFIIDKPAPMYQARCYAPYIYDKETLYERKLPTDTATKGGAGAAVSIKRKLSAGLQISPYAKDTEAKDPRTGDNSHEGYWSRYMINMGQYKTSFEDNDRKQIYNDNSQASKESVKFYGIRSGLCDGTYRNISKKKASGSFEFNSGTNASGFLGLTSLSGFYSCTSSKDNCPGTSKKATTTESKIVIDRVRGADVGVKFINSSGNTDGQFVAEAGASGYNSHAFSEMETDLLNLKYWNILKNEVMQTFDNTTSIPGFWRDLYEIEDEDKYEVASLKGNILTSSYDTNLYEVNKISSIPYNTFSSSPYSNFSIEQEIKILNEQGGGSARYICDNDGNARSRNFTGTAETPNIEIVPGRIWLKFTSIGKNGISGVQGNDSKTPNEHTKIVNKTGQKSIFGIQLGQGGTITSPCTKENSDGLINEGGILGLGGDEIGYYCNGNQGDTTTIFYNGKQVVEYEGLKGGTGYNKVSIENVAQDLEEYLKELTEIKFGLGSFRNYPANRLFVQLFYGNDEENPICVYDSLNSNCANTPNTQATDNEAQPGKGAKVRIIW